MRKTSGDSSYRYVSVEGGNAPKLVNELADTFHIDSVDDKKLAIKLLNNIINEYDQKG